MGFKKEYKKAKQKAQEIIDNPSLIEDGILKLSKHIANASKNIQKHAEDFIEKLKDEVQHGQTIYTPEIEQNTETSQSSEDSESNETSEPSNAEELKDEVQHEQPFCTPEIEQNIEVLGRSNAEEL